MSKKVFFNWQCCCISTVVSLIVIISLVATSVRNVDHDEYAIVYNSISKVVDPEVRMEGKHLLPVGSSLIFFRRTYVTIEFAQEDGDEVECLSRNGLKMVLDMTMQYQWQNGKIIDIFRNFGTNDLAHNFLMFLARETFREVCSLYDAVDFFGGGNVKDQGKTRAAIQEKMRNALTESFSNASTYADLQQVQLLNIKLPLEVDRAINEVQQADLDSTKARQEELQELQKAGVNLNKATYSAQTFINDANEEKLTIMYKAGQDVAALEARFDQLAESFATVLNSTGMSPEAFVTSYLESQLLRQVEGSSTNPPIIAFN